MSRRFTRDYYRDRAMLGLSNKRPPAVLPPLTDTQRARVAAAAEAYQRRMT